MTQIRLCGGCKKAFDQHTKMLLNKKWFLARYSAVLKRTEIFRVSELEIVFDPKNKTPNSVKRTARVWRWGKGDNGGASAVASSESVAKAMVREIIDAR